MRKIVQTVYDGDAMARNLQVPGPNHDRVVYVS